MYLLVHYRCSKSILIRKALANQPLPGSRFKYGVAVVQRFQVGDLTNEVLLEDRRLLLTAWIISCSD